MFFVMEAHITRYQSSSLRIRLLQRRPFFPSSEQIFLLRQRCPSALFPFSIIQSAALKLQHVITVILSRETEIAKPAKREERSVSVPTPLPPPHPLHRTTISLSFSSQWRGTPIRMETPKSDSLVPWSPVRLGGLCAT